MGWNEVQVGTGMRAWAGMRPRWALTAAKVYEAADGDVINVVNTCINDDGDPGKQHMMVDVGDFRSLAMMVVVIGSQCMMIL